MENRHKYGIFSREVAGETQYFALLDMRRPTLNGDAKYCRFFIIKARWYEENGEIVIDDDYIQQKINEFYQNSKTQKKQ
jgi:hypothetical protein